MEIYAVLKKAAKNDRKSTEMLYDSEGKKTVLFCREIIGKIKKADITAIEATTDALKKLREDMTDDISVFDKRIVNGVFDKVNVNELISSGSDEFSDKLTERDFPKAKSETDILLGIVELLPLNQRIPVLLKYAYGLSDKDSAELLKKDPDEYKDTLDIAEQSIKAAVKNIKIADGKFANVISFTQLRRAFEETVLNLQVSDEAKAVSDDYIKGSTSGFFGKKRNIVLTALLGVIVVGLIVFLGISGFRNAHPDEAKIKDVHHVEIHVKDYGTISVELNGDMAPITVKNFIKLADEGFYDGLTFHRVLEGELIQGGDPNKNGTGGSGQCIKGEFVINGVANTLPHKRGAIAMARSTDYDSASSQFYIMDKDDQSLGGQYAVFGYVTDGMKIVDKLCNAEYVVDSNGIISPAYQPVIEKITVID